MNKYGIILFILLLWSIGSEAQTPDKSVVKISVTKQEYDYSQPWQKSKQSKSSGSGCIIDSNYILTCAHVVEFGAFIEVRKAKENKKYTASVAFLAPEYDLALLKVEDEGFFNRTTPIQIGELPDIGEKVTVYGFPTGGNDLGITTGIISRIENIDYSYDNYNDLGIQIDAAINPGNSGGPVLIDSTLAGIAFQGRSSSQNIGYMIPTTVIKSFLNDVQDGVYEGPVPVYINWQNMESSTLRSCYGLPDTLSGILINDVHYCSAFRGVVQPNDILLSIDSIPIQNDGTLYINYNLKANFETYLKNRNRGDSVVLQILRDNRDTLISCTLDYGYSRPYLINKVDLNPRYLIQNGFVFTTPSYYYFQGESYWQYYNSKLSAHYYSKALNSPETEELVIISSVLPHHSNVGYHDVSNRLITKINGIPLSNFNDLIEAFHATFADYIVLEDDSGRKYIIDNLSLKENNAAILKKFGIDRQMRN